MVYGNGIIMIDAMMMNYSDVNDGGDNAYNMVIIIMMLNGRWCR